MRRIAFGFAVVFLAASAVAALAQETQTTPLASVLAATRSQAECTGFIASPSVPDDLFVVDGEDDDFHSVVRSFSAGDSIFISSRGGQDFVVGTEYSVVRRAKDIFRTRRYSRQGWDLNRLGKPYEDIGRVKVTHETPFGTVAEVAFACGPILPGDLLVPYQPRPIPEYTVGKQLDRFAPPDENKQHGMITAALNNYGYAGERNVVYVNLGEDVGTKPGQRFRIIKPLPAHPTGFLRSERTPPETVGEAVVLSVQANSCVAIIVNSVREVSAGDAVEAE
ncbi:MAG: hypothetical protein LAO04_04670 [Acidobacteriia bacterium]|nr:hypothetical protein [Terriglobia bacterium]